MMIRARTPKDLAIGATYHRKDGCIIRVVQIHRKDGMVDVRPAGGPPLADKRYGMSYIKLRAEWRRIE